MQKTLDKIDQLIDLHTTMERDSTVNKLKEIRDEVVGMYREEEVRNAIDYGAKLGLSGNIGNSFEWEKRQDEWFEKFKNKSND
jgi:hypothetical protein